MKRVSFFVLLGAVLVVFVALWRIPGNNPTETKVSFSEIERDLHATLKRLRHASENERKGDSSLSTKVMALADVLAEVGDAREKQVAREAKKEVGQILFGEASASGAEGDGASEIVHQIVRFPERLPVQRFAPLPLQSYIGAYAGRMTERPVTFIVSVTDRNLLGIRIVGLGNQPTMEFAELQPQEFFRPDTRTIIVFADPTDSGFRTLYFLQNGMRERAENTFVSATARKRPVRPTGTLFP